MIDILKTLTDEKNIKTFEPMSKHTTFRIGGDADIFIMPSSLEELESIVSLMKKESYPYIVVGNGSNLLISDKGIEGAVICTENLTSVSVDGNHIFAECGIKLSALAAEATRNSLSGLEFAAGIPGTLGGGVFMNAGAYDGEMKNVIKTVKILRDGDIVDLPAELCNFGYRHSIFQDTDDVILGAEMELTPANKDDISIKIQDLAARRKLKQPLEFPSAGSVFKRPEGYFAGKLIEDSGLRGFQLGGAQVSEKHCGFIINRGGATASDVQNLIKHIKTSVYVRFGVKLQSEIRFIGRR